MQTDETTTTTVEKSPTPSPQVGTSVPTLEQTDTELQDTEEPPDRVGTDRIVWESDLAYSADTPPALVDGDCLLVGDSNGIAAQVAPSDGSVQWTFETRLPVQATPIRVGETVVVLDGRYTENFNVYALAASDGTPQWQFQPDEQRLDILGTNDGVVFVATSDQTPRTDGEMLYALSVADGKTKWTAEIGDNSGGLVTDDAVYVAASDTVTAVGMDGSTRWTYSGSNHLSRSLGVAGDTVVFAMSSERGRPTIHGVDTTTGDQRWTFDDWEAFSIRTEDDTLFVGGEKLARLNPATGAIRWETDLTVAKLAPGSGDNRWIDSWRLALSDAIVNEHILYTGGASAAAVAIEDGTVVWEHNHDAALSRPAGLTDDGLAHHASMSTDDRSRHLLALDPTSGDQQWEFAGQSRVTDPAVGTERVYVAESGSGLVALEL